MFPALRVLAGLKVLRGGFFDVFGRTQERRAERALLASYERMVDEIAVGLTPANHAAAVALASLPQKIRGFGPVKEKSMQAGEGRGSQVSCTRSANPKRPGQRWRRSEIQRDRNGPVNRHCERREAT